jgi:hypothetical protein
MRVRAVTIGPTVKARPPLIGVVVWWLGLGVVLSLVLAALVDVAYSRNLYLFVVMPVGGILLFPVAWAANRWLTPPMSSWLRGIRSG